MNNFFTSYFIYFKELSNKLVNEENEPLNLFIGYFLEANKLFHVQYEYAKEVIISLLVVKDNYVDLTSVFKFYDKKYSIKIGCQDFITITFDYLAMIFHKIEKTFFNFFELVDVTDNGFLNFLEFEKFVLLILQSNDNKWKISEYFK